MNPNPRPQSRSTANGNAGTSAAPGAGKKRMFRVVTPLREEGQDKTFWTRVGVAFENEAKGDREASISIKLNALPLGRELVLFPDDGEGE